MYVDPLNKPPVFFGLTKYVIPRFIGFAARSSAYSAYDTVSDRNTPARRPSYNTALLPVCRGRW